MYSTNVIHWTYKRDSLFAPFVNFEDKEKKSERYACYSPSYVSPYLEKIVPEDLRPQAVHKTVSTVFPNMDRPRLVNNIFIFKPKTNHRKKKPA